MEKKKEQNRGYKAHALLLPVPGQGHINPILQFAKRLASKGVKSTIAITAHIAKSSTRSDPTHTNLIQIEPISDGFDQGGYAAAESNKAYFTTFKEVGSRSLSDLITKLAGLGDPVGSLVYDPHLPWAVDVANRFGLLKVAFFTQSCAVGNVYYHVNRGLLRLPLSGDVVSLPGLPPLRRSEVPSFLNDYESGSDYLDLVVGQFDNIDEADWVLQNTFYELEPEGIDWASKLWRLRTIGPLVPSSYLDNRLTDDTQYGLSFFNPNTTPYHDWLTSKPPSSVVYVSFGSLASPSAEKTEELGRALQQSGYNFLWVVREEEQSKLPENFISETAEQGLVVPWCRQLEVLAAESVGCFVTHCGLNSVYEAMCLGVPMVAVPQWTDQCTNGKFVEDVWGIGVRAWPDGDGVLRRGELEGRIREVMEGEKGKVVKGNVMRFRGLARESVGEGGRSDRNIDEFVAGLWSSLSSVFEGGRSDKNIDKIVAGL